MREKTTKSFLSKRSINFDLSSEKLRLNFGENGRKLAYKKLEKFFTDNGFSHRQWSGYVSNRALSDAEVLNINKNLFVNFPWLETCANRLDVTNISEQYDLIQLHNLDMINDKALEPETIKESIVSGLNNCAIDKANVKVSETEFVDNVKQVDRARGEIHIFQDKNNPDKNYIGKKIEINGQKKVQSLSSAMNLKDAQEKLKSMVEHKEKSVVRNKVISIGLEK